MNKKTKKLLIASYGIRARLLLFLAFVFLVATTAYILPANQASAAIYSTINFQGKVVNSNGTNIADGTYNMQFKLYTGGDGVVGGGDETLQWTEERLRNNAQGVVITDGIFQVNLGSVTALPDIFNNNTIWLSMNVGNTNATCTPFSNCVPDGEMSPMIRLTAAPYALNSDKLGGLQASNFVQLAQGLQTDSSTANPSIFINKTGGTANVLQLQRAGGDILVIDTNGLSTFFDDVDLSFAGSENLAISHDLAGTINVLNILGTPNAAANTAYGLYIDQADSANANGFDAALVIDNSDVTGAPIADGILFVNAGSGFTRGITLAGATTDITTGTNENLVLDANGTGVLVFTGYDCSAQINGGALTADASGNISCSADDSGGSPTWNSIAAPTGNLSLSHADFTTAFSFDTAADAARTYFGLSVTNDLATDTTAQRLLSLTNSDDAIATGTTEALLYLNNADANEAVTAGIQFANTGGGGFTAGIDMSNLTIVNVGAAGTDFSSTGGLTLADNLTVTAGGATITAGALAVNSDSITSDGILTINATNEVFLGDGTNGLRVEETFGATSGWRGTARPTVKVTLTPEYPGAVLTGDGAGNTGTMTSDFCGNDGAGSFVDINTTVCASGDFHNYYTWTHTAAADYDVWVRWQVPSDFDGFASSTSINMFGWRTDATATTEVQLSLWENGTQCGTTTNVATGTAVWTETALGGDETTCSGIAAGDVVFFKIHMEVAANKTVRAGEVRFDYRSRF